MKSMLSLYCLALGWHVWGQSGISGLADVYLTPGDSLCGGAAQVVQIRANVTGLTGTGGEPAGLNAASIEIQVTGAARSWLAGALGGEASPEESFQVRITSPDQVAISGLLRWVSWTHGDTPNRDYVLGELVFSGASSSGSGELTLTGNGDLASKWWDDGSTDGDGPAELSFVTGAPLTISVPTWPGWTLDQACALWTLADVDYDFSVPADGVDILDLVELVTCRPHF